MSGSDPYRLGSLDATPLPQTGNGFASTGLSAITASPVTTAAYQMPSLAGNGFDYNFPLFGIDQVGSLAGAAPAAAAATTTTADTSPTAGSPIAATSAPTAPSGVDPFNLTGVASGSEGSSANDSGGNGYGDGQGYYDGSGNYEGTDPNNGSTAGGKPEALDNGQFGHDLLAAGINAGAGVLGGLAGPIGSLAAGAAAKGLGLGQAFADWADPIDTTDPKDINGEVKDFDTNAGDTNATSSGDKPDAAAGKGADPADAGGDLKDMSTVDHGWSDTPSPSPSTGDWSDTAPGGAAAGGGGTSVDAGYGGQAPDDRDGGTAGGDTGGGAAGGGSEEGGGGGGGGGGGNAGDGGDQDAGHDSGSGMDGGNSLGGLITPSRLLPSGGPDSPAPGDNGVASIKTGEFVVNKAATQADLPELEAINAQGNKMSGAMGMGQGMSTASPPAGQQGGIGSGDPDDGSDNGWEDNEADESEDAQSPLMPFAESTALTPSQAMQNLAVLPPDQAKSLAMTFSDPNTAGAMLSVLGPNFAPVLQQIMQAGAPNPQPGAPGAPDPTQQQGPGGASPGPAMAAPPGVMPPAMAKPTGLGGLTA